MKFSNPLKSRDQRLPMYQNINKPNKERESTDGYYSSDGDSESSISGPSSSHKSRYAPDSQPGRPLLSAPKPSRQPLNSSRLARFYPYRLPPRVIRYVVFTIIGLLGLMIFSLIRASLAENWRVTNGEGNNRPPPPPMWEKFPFLERYYGGLRTLVPFKENEPEYPRLNEPIPLNSESAPNQDAAKDSVKDAAKDQEKKFASSSSWDAYPGRSEEHDIKQCFLDAAGKVRPPALHYFNGRPSGFPEPVLGSYDLLKLPEEICFDRYGRYGPYGFGYSARTGGLGTGETGHTEGADEVWASDSRVDYRDIDWADVQRRCFQANSGRYNDLPSRIPSPGGFYVGQPKSNGLETRDAAKPESTTAETASETATAISKATTTATDNKKEAPGKPEAPQHDKAKDKAEKKSRTAMVVRCWDEYFFREDDFANLRSMIAELSMASGGRYDVHLLVQVRNDARYPIWADHESYEQRIKDSIPKEFRGLVTLWSETQMLSLYQGVYDVFARGPDHPVHGVYRGLSMAMQHFAYLHPEYDYFWQWEMDIRYTGHYYDLLTKLENWSKAQPRKGIWERNSRFYFPSVHGSWEDFSQMTRVQSEMGTVSADNIWKNVPGTEGQPPENMAKKKYKTVWGPLRPADENDWFETDKDPSPPTSFEADKYAWGVGEEADLITLNPMFDPEGTTWGLRDDITGYNRSNPLPPRRASIICSSRLSRRLLLSMHRMTAHKKQFAFPEMWPATVALQHGYKAVFAPHPIYVDRKWPVEYMAQTYNGGRDGTSGGSRTSLFGDREHNLLGLTWFYNSGFGPNLYRRWLGLKVNNDGGEEFELTEDQTKNANGVGGMAGGEGRMCLPPMLLHPVKEVDLPIEAPPLQDEQVADDAAPITDPSA